MSKLQFKKLYFRHNGGNQFDNVHNVRCCASDQKKAIYSASCMMWFDSTSGNAFKTQHRCEIPCAFKLAACRAEQRNKRWDFFVIIR